MYHHFIKKDNKNNRDNYETANILLVLIKVYEKLMHKQIHSHFDQIFAKLQCSFCKGFSTEH